MLGRKNVRREKVEGKGCYLVVPGPVPVWICGFFKSRK
jgi:hypothetical protein